MLFPEPAMKVGVISDMRVYAIKDHTLSMNPQQGARRLPFLEDILVENPSCGSLVMSAARDVVICRWIRWV